MWQSATLCGKFRARDGGALSATECDVEWSMNKQGVFRAPGWVAITPWIVHQGAALGSSGR